MFNILHRVGIKSSSDKIFEALTDEEGLAGWWSKNVTASPVVGPSLNSVRRSRL